MFSKILDVIKEVFWIKKTKRRVKASVKRQTIKKKKSTDKKISRPVKSVSKKSSSVSPARIASKVKQNEKVKVPPLKKIKEKPLDPNLLYVGHIGAFFDRIKVAVVIVDEGSLLIGDKIHILGPKTKVLQKVWSMQVNREDIKVAKSGQEIGLKVDKTVSVGDKIYKMKA